MPEPCHDSRVTNKQGGSVLILGGGGGGGGGASSVPKPLGSGAKAEDESFLLIFIQKRGQNIGKVRDLNHKSPPCLRQTVLHRTVTVTTSPYSFGQWRAGMWGRPVRQYLEPPSPTGPTPPAKKILRIIIMLMSRGYSETRPPGIPVLKVKNSPRLV